MVGIQIMPLPAYICSNLYIDDNVLMALIHKNDGRYIAYYHDNSPNSYL